jgi:hypothetical protein
MNYLYIKGEMKKKIVDFILKLSFMIDLGLFTE